MQSIRLSRIAIFIGLVAMVVVLGACTRERDPWPDAAGGATIAPEQSTPSGTMEPDEASLPAFTPHITADASGNISQPQTQDGGGAPVPAGSGEAAPAAAVTSNLPPMPDTKELTPKPPTSTPEPDLFAYKVQAGDNLSSIAEKFGVTVEDIKRYNAMENPNALRTGAILIIPGEPPSGTETEEGYIHVVKPGETLFGISMQYGVPLNELASANQITDPSTLRVGQRLVIPNAAESQGVSSESRVHIVRPGETLSSISVKYGVTPAAIMQANDMENANRIYSGQKLVIPN
ncbi:MAG: LysM peptidoglycan-binding domain-containing protein [Chloroflexi bacterium]|nr:LysM peptidoglycan-binding domain-containing protein [Chloroflexota bacterium]